MFYLPLKKWKQRTEKGKKNVYPYTKNWREILNMQVEDNPQITDRMETKDGAPSTQLR